MMTEPKHSDSDPSSESFDLFRDEALRHHRNEAHDGGRILEISPAWSLWTYWLVLTVVVAGGFYSVFGTINQYAEGPAIIRAEGRTNLTARWEGTVELVESSFGERVDEGDILVRFDMTDEVAERERLDREYELQLIRFLRNPTDQSVRQSLASLRADLELAEARLEQRVVRSPHPGIVSDIRIRQGQHLTPGEVILSITDDDKEF